MAASTGSKTKSRGSKLSKIFNILRVYEYFNYTRKHLSMHSMPRWRASFIFLFSRHELKSLPYLIVTRNPRSLSLLMFGKAPGRTKENRVLRSQRNVWPFHGLTWKAQMNNLYRWQIIAIRYSIHIIYVPTNANLLTFGECSLARRSSLSTWLIVFHYDYDWMRGTFGIWSRRSGKYW